MSLYQQQNHLPLHYKQDGYDISDPLVATLRQLVYYIIAQLFTDTCYKKLPFCLHSTI